MKFIWLVLLTVLSVPMPPLFASTPQDYDRALGEVQVALANQAQAMRIEEVPTSESPSLVAQRVLAPIHSVEMPGVAPQPVETTSLMEALKSAERVRDPEAKAAAFEALDRQITTLRHEIIISLPARASTPDSQKVVRSARAVLAGEAFASDPVPPPSSMERFATWLENALSRLFPKPTNKPIGGPNINPLIILDIIRGILILAGVAVFGLLISLLVRVLGQRSARAKPLALDEEEATLVEARDKDSLLVLAEQHSKRGDFRRAFRLVYLASLVALDTGGIIRFDRSKTNWEYLRALRAAGRSDVYQAMTPLTREFDQVWYGFGHADASHYARALAQHQALLAAPQGVGNS